MYSDGGNEDRATALLGTAAGAPSFGTPFAVSAGASGYMGGTAISSDSFVAAYMDLNQVANGGYARVLPKTGPPVTTLLGIADEDGTASESVAVILHGVSDHHSGLTPGSVYYQDSDDLTKVGATKQVGMALSSTDLLLDIER